MKIIKPVAASLLSLSLVLAGCGNTQTSILESIAKDIHCPGNYGGHQQGMATDRQTAFFWSHTTQLAKTDLHGNLLNVIDVPSHHGDLDYYQGKVYVAANLAGFNGQAPADSWVYVYDAQDLSLIARHSVPELVFGAGGIAIHDGRFIVVGGLPGDYEENYAYEYNADFEFIERHIIKSGHTGAGIQTAAWFDGCWWFGCYGMPHNPGFLKTDESFNLVASYDLNFAWGIIGVKNNQFLQGGEFGQAIVTHLPPE